MTVCDSHDVTIRLPGAQFAHVFVDNGDGRIIVEIPPRWLPQTTMKAVAAGPLLARGVATQVE